MRLPFTSDQQAIAMAQRGEAQDYYMGGAPPQQPEDPFNGGQQPQYNQPPPQYGQKYAAPQGPPPLTQQQGGYEQQGYDDGKQTFEQQFKIAKPKYNDWWAGALLIAVFLGYVAVSAISIRGYCEYNALVVLGSRTNLPSQRKAITAAFMATRTNSRSTQTQSFYSRSCSAWQPSSAMHTCGLRASSRSNSSGSLASSTSSSGL